MMAHLAEYGRRKLEGDERALPVLSYPFSLGYEALVRLRNRSYELGLLDVCRLPVPVISVGNITLGGTGKTPTVIMLARIMKELGYRPAVISRGYGGKHDSPVTIVSDGRLLLSTAEEAGDEPLLIARSLRGVPVLVGRRRVEVGKLALSAFDVNLLILDDAFQHRRIARDVDILLINGERPFGNGCLLPGGALREPLSSVRRADMVIVTDGRGWGLENDMERLAPGTPVFYAERRPRDLVDALTGEILPLDFLKDKRVAAFAGIAFPARFRDTLAPWCGSIAAFLPFSDHYRYNKKDLADLRFAASDADVLVTTEKDGVRLKAGEDLNKRLLLFRIEMCLVPSAEEPVALIREMIQKGRTS